MGIELRIGTKKLQKIGKASLKIDRSNDAVAHLYNPTHPGIIRFIKQTVAAAQEANISVSVCGEMAAEPLLVPLLLGLGINELSTSAPLIPQVKYLIRRLKYSDCQPLAEKALKSHYSSEIEEACAVMLATVAPELTQQ